jgi:hypothetical protein
VGTVLTAPAVLGAFAAVGRCLGSRDRRDPVFTTRSTSLRIRLFRAGTKGDAVVADRPAGLPVAAGSAPARLSGSRLP